MAKFNTTYTAAYAFGPFAVTLSHTLDTEPSKPVLHSIRFLDFTEGVKSQDATLVAVGYDVVDKVAKADDSVVRAKEGNMNAAWATLLREHSLCWEGGIASVTPDKLSGEIVRAIGLMHLQQQVTGSF